MVSITDYIVWLYLQISLGENIVFILSNPPILSPVHSSSSNYSPKSNLTIRTYELRCQDSEITIMVLKAPPKLLAASKTFGLVTNTLNISNN